MSEVDAEILNIIDAQALHASVERSYPMAEGLLSEEMFVDAVAAVCDYTVANATQVLEHEANPLIVGRREVFAVNVLIRLDTGVEPIAAAG